MTITAVPTPDPYVVFLRDTFFLTFTSGNRVEIWSSPTLLGFYTYPRKTVVWQPEHGYPFSGNIWAPELHALCGRWYIYVSCDHPLIGNASHRLCVLRGPPTDVSPCEAPWEFLGPLPGLPPHQWSIDGTVFELDDQLYCVYSGWPLLAGYPGESIKSMVERGRSQDESIQELYIAHMASPELVDSFAVRISAPEHRWEFSGSSGINEGPQYLKASDGSWKGIVFSCAGSWTRDYKMATLQYVGGEPLNPRAWVKSRRPLLQAWSPKLGSIGEGGRRDVGPFGPGHGSFIRMPHGMSGTADEDSDGGMLCVFHATDRPDSGWEGRKARAQRVSFTSDGPDMGGFVGRVTTDVDEFMGCRAVNILGVPGGHGGRSRANGNSRRASIKAKFKGLLGCGLR
ncbi:Arabinanase/levansucrase/invertase [Eremomyces bilateralis CBS 781.70]|uniref:Arabinanase/levansucrase/invertase n=1 Tax=Eremomyces bilateralis CBS 781.70 TaxID=1392243 RepID=A0A6G1GAP3_9PEZI|nr:Arabinanase/levansucrase/invertase [Eremomyces bilateralis CBS 781.70]KAF1814970.1 Arabinanase/levansucrase/invertase [Eremomyces bilateralis CBS 781.70]